MSAAPRPGRRQRRLGQNFLADPNLLELIVREASLVETDVLLEVGGGGGALTERLAPEAALVHVIEADERLRPELEPLAAEAKNVQLTWGDALRVDLGALAPPPTKMVSNLPYSIATPLLLRVFAELPSLAGALVLIQREIAERLASAPGSRIYGSPSAVLQLSCRVDRLRNVDPAVFTPRPRVESALVRITRVAATPSEDTRNVIRGAFAHRRKSLARSLELARPGSLEPARAALSRMDLPEDARAEALYPEELARLAEMLRQT